MHSEKQWRRQATTDAWFGKTSCWARWERCEGKNAFGHHPGRARKALSWQRRNDWRRGLKATVSASASRAATFRASQRICIVSSGAKDLDGLEDQILEGIRDLGGTKAGSLRWSQNEEQRAKEAADHSENPSPGPSKRPQVIDVRHQASLPGGGCCQAEGHVRPWFPPVSNNRWLHERASHPHKWQNLRKGVNRELLLVPTRKSGRI